MSGHQYGSHSSGGAGNLMSDGTHTRPYEAAPFAKVQCIYTQAQVDALVAAAKEECATAAESAARDYAERHREHLQLADNAPTALRRFAKQIRECK